MNSAQIRGVRAGRAVGALLVSVLLAMIGLPQAQAQDEEQSPIRIELVVPERSGPGSLIEVLVHYDLVDPNAGADLNYNVFGPCHVVKRDPEPRVPSANTWSPGHGMPAKGTIQIQVQVDPGTEGQAISHQVQVRWGSKSRSFSGQTSLVYIPPTPTPTPTPRPQVTATRAAPEPTTIPVPTLILTEVVFLNADGAVISSTDVNQQIRLRIGYSSTADIADLAAEVRFEPDVVNVDGLQQGPVGFLLSGLVLPAGDKPGGAVFDLPIKGRIRPYLEQESGYELHATVQLLPSAALTMTLSGSPASAVVQVTQSLLVTVQASLEANAVRAGGSAIVHVACENHGRTPVGPVKVSLVGLPVGLAASPAEQAIDRIPDGGVEERLFTIHVPQSFEGPFTFTAAAQMGDIIIESPQTKAETVPAMPLMLEVSADRSTVQAGESLVLTAHVANPGRLQVEDIVARVVDSTQHLAGPDQSLGSLPSGETRDVTFVIDVPQDFPGDVVSSLIVQTVSKDGTISTSTPLSMPVLCRPRFEVLVQPFAGSLRSGQSAEVTSLVRNTSQCDARDLFVSVENLPAGFAPPAPQKVPELAPGGTRQMVFSLLVPPGYQGDGSLEVAVVDGGGNRARSQPIGVSVTALPTLSIVAFGLLALLAAIMALGGAVMYFRER